MSRKPLAALLVEEREGKGGGEPPAPDEGGDEEQMLASECAGLMGAGDTEAAGAALVDVIRACMAKSRKGGYSK